MTETLLTDAAPLSSTRRTADGYLVANCRIARAGNVQTYTGAEVGKPEMATARIYRPEAAVFDTATMAAWAHKPITLNHPRSGTVNAENWRDEAVGLSGGEIGRDGEFLTVPMMLADAMTIADVEGGTAELSCGYRVALDWQPGVTPTGEPYDASVTRLAPNHIAIVPRGRAGSECRIGDASRAALATSVPTPPTPQENRPMADTDNGRAVILVDGFTVATTPQGVEAIKRLQTQLADAASAHETERATHRTALDGANGQLAAARQSLSDAMAAKDGEIAGLKLTHQTALDAAAARIAELEAQTSPAALEARSAVRAGIVAVARRVLGDAFTGAGLSDAEIRKAAVVKAMGPSLADADSKPDLFFDHVFEVVATQPVAQPAKPDPMRAAIANGAGALALDAAAQQAKPPSAFERHLQRLDNSWKTAGSQGAA